MVNDTADAAQLRKITGDAEPINPIEHFHTRINREMGKALMDYRMIRNGDRILVAVSGGKDSLCLLHFLQEFQKKAPVNFELLAVNVDQGQPGFPEKTLPDLFSKWQVPFWIEKQDTYSVVVEKTRAGKSFCSLCSRLRRGILYRIARERNCNKIALGHHRDDLMQTFLLNAFFSGKLGTMPPIYRIAAGDLTVIRPLCFVDENWLGGYSNAMSWPIVPCNLCGSQEEMRRKEMGALLMNLDERYPGIKNSLSGAMKNPHRNELLDPALWSHPDYALPGGE